MAGSPSPAERARATLGTKPRTALWHRQGRGPITAVAVENEILRLLAVMEERTDELDARARFAAEAEANYKGRWASEFLKSQAKTELQRKSEADEICHELFLHRKIEEGLYQSCKEALFTIRAQVDALRSISANIRAQT